MAQKPQSGGLSHEKVETNNFLMIALILVVLLVGGMVEIVPLFFQKSTTEAVPGLKPYTAVQVVGRDIYVREGCYNCHSQMIRPIHAETLRYGEFSKGGEFVYDHPFQWGSRRIGPDVHRVGGKYSHTWHIRHMIEPASVTEGSIMPNYPHLIRKPLDWSVVQSRVRAMTWLGVPYSEYEVENAEMIARAQAKSMVEEILLQDGPGAIPGPEECPPGLENTQMIALVAYLQRLGTDLTRVPETDVVEPMVATTAEAEGGPDGG